MILTADVFYDEIEQFTSFPDQVTEVTEECFQKVFGSDAARSERNILYVWRCKKAVTRLRGKSDVLYIGQTKQTLRNRYFRWSKNIAESKANNLKYSHILEKYGPITISYVPFERFGETLKLAEEQLLWWYFQNHCEYPPINYTKTTTQNDFLEIKRSILDLD